MGIPSQDRNQGGAALIIGLVLLAVLTVLAISTLRTASLELLMAGNTQFRENAFQLAESGLAARMRQVNAAVPLPPLTVTCPGGAEDGPVRMEAMQGSYTTAVCYEGYTSSLEGGDSLGKIGAYHFQLRSTGRTDQRDAEADLVQGFYVRGPAQ